MRAEMSGGRSLSQVRGFVEFNSADLTTNNGLRDRDMRSSLEVKQYPTIRFDLDSVGVKSDGADSARVDLLGRMQIHGVTKPITVPALVRRSPGSVRVTGDFDLVVTDYGIKGLKKMLGMLSMDETVRIGLDLTFTIAREGTEGAR
jgi:polyisoprenoid-binding protein YceI